MKYFKNPFLNHSKHPQYGYGGRMMGGGGYYMSPSLDPSYAGGPNFSPEQRLQQQVQVLRERVDQLEREVDTLRRISMHDWNATDSGSLYKVFGTPKSWEDAQVNLGNNLWVSKFFDI